MGLLKQNKEKGNIIKCGVCGKERGRISVLISKPWYHCTRCGDICRSCVKTKSILIFFKRRKVCKKCESLIRELN